MKGFRYLEDVTTLQFDPARCTGCGRCVEVCPHQVFAVQGRKAELMDRDACMECGACAKNCAARAITVDAGVGCASGLINEWLQERKLLKGIKTGGCCQ
ncbi:mercury methylation ferredoxin HgcB [Geomesophilobacter sediminis]|uniref:4Fe-4S binding protein n=1 Tax=Geomesophilobacter sediminis TaxID=2798584 RepID=A0A8J7M468_9BACT|nr:mercury methylation ferredoxin HgcB [Geomesophilobacter sediminis]MBJ6727771.1 4Fe-4S binding protein [Geomesophilobacter sediminis]